MDIFVREKLQEWNLSSLTDILEGMYLVSVDISYAWASFKRKNVAKPERTPNVSRAFQGLNAAKTT